MATPARLWLVLYAPPIASRLVRRIVGPFATVDEAIRARPDCPSESCVGWRLMRGRRPPAVALIDEGGELPAERSPDPTIRSAQEALLLERLTRGAVVSAGRHGHARVRALHRRGLIDGSGAVTVLGRRELQRYRSRRRATE